MKYFVLLLSTLALAGDPEIDDISRHLDQLYRSDSSRGAMSMTVTTPHYSRTLHMQNWTMGKDFSLVRITEPRKEKGVATLKRENEMWNWLPKIKKMVRVPPSMMMGSWMGSDFTNDDLMRDSSWEDDYVASRNEALSDDQTLVVDYTPKPEAAVTWQKVVTVFDRQTKLPMRQDFYDEKGRKVREMVFDQVKNLGGREIPSRLVLVPLLKEGHRTEVVYEEMAFDIELDPNLFSKNGLKKGL